mmetsp:Transcript_1975/g.5983  ORF Transcript_1975/g.5983 Transcript_1975/m.5983 type:complete len:244 (-) Transcript_1975:480-1211(-)
MGARASRGPPSRLPPRARAAGRGGRHGWGTTARGRVDGGAAGLPARPARRLDHPGGAGGAGAGGRPHACLAALHARGPAPRGCHDALWRGRGRPCGAHHILHPAHAHRQLPGRHRHPNCAVRAGAHRGIPGRCPHLCPCCLSALRVGAEGHRLPPRSHTRPTARAGTRSRRRGRRRGNGRRRPRRPKRGRGRPCDAARAQCDDRVLRRRQLVLRVGVPPRPLPVATRAHLRLMGGSARGPARR